ncbi:L-amino acid N-acyltransferase YncA [Agrococcus baldri]|uniref:L-amino acid N-acyltransferase YncA n=1 Tax=Agrococcus baldri TaxID=153730 RepID=A0AA94HLT0_9MICO|nr:GNAT family N-acetyltransferase [Agrococcus baldri]SFS08908.1 L-amino acid N-acyltransferase YncA [Agrococcus baldri]
MELDVEVHPATADRFEAVGAILAPKSADGRACWCLSYRLPNAEFREMHGPAALARLRRFADEGTPPGVVATVDGEPAGWCSVAPRTSHHRLTHSRTIPVVDDVPVWSIVCIVVRPQFRRQGMARRLLEGAIDYARAAGAPMLEAYPVDPEGARVSPALAYVGTTGLFASVGFERIVATDSKSAGLQRWLMRRELP